MPTKEQLIQRVGEDLALVPIGQDLEQHDILRIEATYNEVYQRVKDNGYATWLVGGTIPDAVMPYVALMMEEKLLTSYSVPDNRYQRIKTDAGPDGEEALKCLADMVTNDYESTSDAMDY